MKIAIMQPYFYPYIGYFQLINAVDEFVIYDNIQYTKKGWINRNRILVNGNAETISLSLKKDSDFLDVRDRYLSEIWDKEKIKLENKIKAVYLKAPEFKNIFPLIEYSLFYDNKNLFFFNLNSLKIILDYLEIETKIIISSIIPIDHNLKSKDKVIAICEARKANVYINPIGGVELYDKNEFENKNIKLNFLKANYFEYKQFNNEFVPWLSIIDVLMFNSKEKVKQILLDYQLQ